MDDSGIHVRFPLEAKSCSPKRPNWLSVREVKPTMPPPNNAYYKNSWNYTSTPVHPFRKWCLITYRYTTVYLCIPHNMIGLSHTHTYMEHYTYIKCRGAKIILKPRSRLKNSRRRVGDVKQFPRWKPTNIRS